MEKRVCLTGCSGSGKSVLAKWISEIYGLEYNPVGSRSVAKEMGFESPYDVDKAGKRAEFQKKLLNDKIAWETARNEFVTDRSTLDNIAYSIFHDVSSIDAQIYEAAACWHSTRYTHVFYCPFDVFCNPDGDPSRMQDLTYHALYDATLSGLLAKNPSRWAVTFDTADLTGRREWIIRVLGVARK